MSTLTSAFDIQLGCWILHPAKLQISGPTGQVILPAKVFEVLNLLLAHPGETISRETFIDTIWRGQKDVGEKALNQAIWQLRKAFAETGEQIEVIATVARKGYLLQLPATDIKKTVSELPKVSWPLLATLLLLPTLLLIWLLPKQDSTTLPTPLLSQRAISLTHYKGAEETPAFTADGNTMAFQWDKGNGLPGIYLVDLTLVQAEPQKISAPDEFGSSPAFSPDGQQVAYAVINNGSCRLQIYHRLTQQRRSIDDCYTESLANTLSWSKTANKLAYAYKNAVGGISIKSYDVVTGTFQQLSQEQADYQDYPLNWANNSETLAFASHKGGLSNIYIREESGRLRTLLADKYSIYSLAWSPDDHYLYFTTVLKSEMVIMQVALKDGQVSPLSYETTPGRITIRPGKQPQLVYPRYSSLEQLYALSPGAIPQPLPFSYGRELYPAYSVSQDKLIFFSNRGGQFQLWSASATDELSQRLTDIEGIPYVHAVSNKGDRFLLPIKQQTDDNYSLFIGDFKEKHLHALPPLNYATMNFSWGYQDNSLLFSADLDGQWQIWRHYLENGVREQLTLNGGLYAQEDAHHTLYFVKPVNGGIWRQLPDGRTEELIPKLSILDWGNWLLSDAGIIYLERTTEADLLQLYQWDGETKLLAMVAPRTVKPGRSIARLPDGRLVLSMYQSIEADIVAVALPTP